MATAVAGQGTLTAGGHGCPECSGLGELEATDIFCGAGGSSLGLEMVCCPACGRSLIRVTQAINHWDLAVEAHNANFPHADHDLHDVEEIPAKRFRRTDILWASPECTHHAYCRGPKALGEEAQRSRATFKDIVRFTEHHRYDAVIVENVIEARLWCDDPSHADKCSCGGHFNAWFNAMCAAGYEGRIVYFNSQFALPTPQSRDRMYIVFWRVGAQAPDLDFQPDSWCSRCETVVQGVQTWKKASPRSARSRPGLFEYGRYGSQYIYTCECCGEPVAPAVVGARSIIDWGLPAERIGDKTRALADKTRARIKTGLERLQNLEPVQVQVGGNLFERPGYARVWSVDAPLRTVTGTGYMSLVVPGKSGSVATPDETPMPTVTGRAHAGIVVRAGGQQGNGRSLEEPMQTVIGTDRQVALVMQNMENNVPRNVDEPGPPVTTGGNHMIVQVNRGSKAGTNEANRSRSVDQPMRTVAGHGELALVSFRNHGDAKPIDAPAHTLAAGGYHHGLLVYNGTPGFVRDMRDAAGTVTGRDKQSLLVPYYGTGVARQTDRPMGTVTGKDRQALVITEDMIDDCLFRMLQWTELLRAQMMHVLPSGEPYNLTARRKDKRGNVRELSNELRVKMIGNAVSSPVATKLGWAVMEALR